MMKENMVRLVGYSERGFINSLLYEIAYREAEKARELFKKLFVLIKWPITKPPPGVFDACDTILVEQSFSDFGDADGLFLFASGADGADGAAVFFEGKRGEDYTLERAWKKFIGSFWSQTRSSGLTSNLFCQVYFKQRLAQALRAGSKENVVEGLTLEAPLDLVGRKRKIGDNPVVLSSVEMVRRHLGDVRFLLMVPEPWTDALQAWWYRDVAAANPAPTGWDVSCWGIITIPEIVQFCRDNGLTRTLDVVNHNKGQLYVEPAEPRNLDLATWLNRHGKRGVGVVYVPKVNANTSLHFSWVGDGCAFRDYLTARASTPPQPMRKSTADALPQIQKFEQHSAQEMDIGKVAEWRGIIESQNAKWDIDGASPH
ncbi:MAG: hypothetical protein U1E05_16700 [Patescibacteria group bacterium]|nr:hypothetical protein [Patescibacteria group bacterium]